MPKSVLMLRVVVKSYRRMLVGLRRYNQQDVASCPFASVPVYDMSLTHADLLCVVGCGFKSKLVQLLSLNRNFEPQRDWRACHQMMQSIAQRVASGLAAAVRDNAAKEAKELCASGQCAAAVVPLQCAIDMGDLFSLAHMAWLLIGGREGIALDEKRGFELAEQGVRLGCHNCQGVVAWCYYWGFGCDRDDALSLELARESSNMNSKYGQLTLGWLYRCNNVGLAADYVKVLAFYRLAAAQGLDEAQSDMGYMLAVGGEGVARDPAEALQWYQFATAQGHPGALYQIAICHELGHGVAIDVAEAIRWYKRALAAGNTIAADALRRLNV